MTERVCAVQYCEFSEDKDAKILPICPSGHWMHEGCIRQFIKNQKQLCCPLCRDSTLGNLQTLFTENSFTRTPSTVDEDLYSSRRRIVQAYHHYPAVRQNAEDTPRAHRNSLIGRVSLT